MLSSLFLLSPFSSAIEITRCPEANEINHVLSDYKLVNLRWYGTTQGGENKGNVARFLQAFYYPHGGNDRALGVLVQCNYLLDAGILQMKVRDNKVLVNKGLYISIVDNPTWIKIQIMFLIQATPVVRIKPKTALLHGHLMKILQRSRQTFRSSCLGWLSSNSVNNITPNKITLLFSWMDWNVDSVKLKRLFLMG